jgi:hypothetical protein
MKGKDEALHVEVLALLSRVATTTCVFGEETLVVYDAFDLVRSVKDCTLLSSKRIIWKIFKDYGDFMELSRLPDGALLCKFPGRDGEAIGLVLEAAIEVLLLLPESHASNKLRKGLISQCILANEGAVPGRTRPGGCDLQPRASAKKKRSSRSRMSTRIQVVFGYCCLSAVVTILTLDRQPSSAFLVATPLLLSNSTSPPISFSTSWVYFLRQLW